MRTFRAAALDLIARVVKAFAAFRKRSVASREFNSNRTAALFVPSRVQFTKSNVIEPIPPPCGVRSVSGPVRGVNPCDGLLAVTLQINRPSRA
jgi:hypothetical protein